MIRFVLPIAALLLVSCTERPVLLGVDDNKNGIGDEVDSYIAGVSLTDTKREKLERLALAYQQSLSVDLRDMKQIKAADEAILSSVSDVFINLTNKNGSRAAANMIQSIETLTLDTMYKRNHYKLLNLAVTSLPKESTESCQQWTKADDKKAITKKSKER